jgi:hypothetical protein
MIKAKKRSRFQIVKLEERIAPTITAVTTQTNGGGNTPKGAANGVPEVTEYQNPTGKAPPGQN